MKRSSAVKHQKRFNHSRPRRGMIKKTQLKVQRRRMHFPDSIEEHEEIQIDI